jgi:MYXO-CTERM domain-containing protein
VPRALRLAILLALLSPGAVKAHELPQGLGLAWHGDAPDALPIVLTNRGLIFAAGGGFALRCGEAYGASVTERPFLVAEPGGSGLLVVTPGAMQWSDDRACTLEASMGIDDPYLGGFAAATDGRSLLVSTLAPDAVSRVLGSTDGGRSWLPRSENRAHEVFTALALAPSDAQRVYAGGTRVDRDAQTLTPLWASSSDGGAHFEVVDLARERLPLAVHPLHADIVFATQPTDDLEPRRRLLRSEDGGQSFVVVLDGLTSVTGLVGSADGSVLWVGAGKEGGLFRSDDGGITFRHVYEDLHEVHCLHQRKDELWVCGNHAPNLDGVWVSADGGQTFAPVLTFPQVTEPVACGAPDDAICEGPWYDWAEELLPPPLADGGASAEIDAGSTMAIADAGSSADGGVVDSVALSSPRHSCAARPGRESQGELLALLVAALAFVRRVRRT